MIKTFISIFVFLIPFRITAQDSSTDLKIIISKFISNVKNRQLVEISSHVKYPIVRELPLPEIRTKEEFIGRFDEMFDFEFISRISKSDPDKDWDQVGYRGIMFENGELWLDFEGNLIALNYQSKTEKNRAEEIVAKESKELYGSVRKYKKCLILIRTSKHQVRVDEMEDGTYRYASWKNNKNMNKKPDLLLGNGLYKSEGSVGNHIYSFKSGRYEYICDVEILGYASPHKKLIVRKDGITIYEEIAKDLR